MSQATSTADHATSSLATTGVPGTPVTEPDTSRPSTIKERVRSIVPPRLLYQVKRATGRAVARPVDLGRLDLIRGQNASALRDPARMTETVERLGLIDEYPDWAFPTAIAEHIGCGLLLSQYPVQLGPYLASLADEPISSYLEIGVQHGGTFAATVTYLEATGHQLERMTAIDIQWAPGVAAFTRRSEHARFLVQSSEESRREIEGTAWGLVFIDGDHSYDACRSDFEMAHRSRAGTIAMHDVTDDFSPGARRVWQEVQSDHAGEYEFAEFVDQYPEVTAHSRTTHLGIGVAKRAA